MKKKIFVNKCCSCLQRKYSIDICLFLVLFVNVLCLNPPFQICFGSIYHRFMYSAQDYPLPSSYLHLFAKKNPKNDYTMVFIALRILIFLSALSKIAVCKQDHA